MSGTSGTTSALPLMRYDLASLSWRTCEDTSLWDLEMSSPTFPEWGMTRAGVLYELPTPERPTVAPAYSSLPTPTADHSRGLPSSTTDYQSLANVAATLLPTPTVQDGENVAAPSQMNRNSHPLNALVRLLPTPTVMDMVANYTPEEWEAWKDKQKTAHENGNGHGASLTQEALTLLPTPTAQAAKHGETPDTTANGHGSNLWDLPTLLPTPQASDQFGAKPIIDRTKVDGYGAMLRDLPWIGASTDPPSTAGSTSSDESHPHLPF
jgi:hypothetical protein